VAWDPLNVFRGVTAGDDMIGGIRDEYDDLALPLLGRLQRGESSAELATFIETNAGWGLRTRFGLRR
jgi:hypothetical protein